MLSQSTSTSPTTTATTTSSGKTESGTPVDLLTTVLHEAEPSHATESGYRGLKPFDTPDPTIQRGNGHDDGKAEPSVFRQLTSVPTNPPPASSTAVVSATNNGPTQCRAATFHGTIASHPPEPGSDTLLTVDNTELPTASRDSTSQPDAVNDWMHYYQFFQSPYDAPSPDLQDAAGDWDFTPVTPRLSMPRPNFPEWPEWGGRPDWNDLSATDHARVHWDHSYNHDLGNYVRRGSTMFRGNPIHHVGHERGYGPLPRSIPTIGAAVDAGDASVQLDRLHDDSPSLCRPPKVASPSSIPASPLVPNTTKAGSSIPHSSEPKPESTPRSKIATFFSKLKAYIKAPFRRHKQ